MSDFTRKPAPFDYFMRWLRVPRKHRAAMLAHDGRCLLYKWIDGEQPVNVLPVMKAARTAFWEGPVAKCDVGQYAAYMDSIEFPWTPLLFKCRFTPCHSVHGDMTLENCVQRPDGSIAFIDLGEPRGLICQELDIAKLCQSWRGWDYCDSIPYIGYIAQSHAQEKTVLTLYLTHLWRLLRHDHPKERIEWAKKELRHISSILTA